jgi:addiction module RelE/StbE family toxin
MVEVSFSQTFINKYKRKIKKNKQIESSFQKKIKIFLNNPFHNTLRTHKLTGNLKDLWSFSIQFDIRVIFYFEDNNSKAIFIDIGSHDEVY